MGKKHEQFWSALIEWLKINDVVVIVFASALIVSGIAFYLSKNDSKTLVWILRHIFLLKI